MRYSLCFTSNLAATLLILFPPSTDGTNYVKPVNKDPDPPTPPPRMVLASLPRKCYVSYNRLRYATCPDPAYPTCERDTAWISFLEQIDSNSFVMYCRKAKPYCFYIFTLIKSARRTDKPEPTPMYSQLAVFWKGCSDLKGTGLFQADKEIVGALKMSPDGHLCTSIDQYENGRQIAKPEDIWLLDDIGYHKYTQMSSLGLRLERVRFPATERRIFCLCDTDGCNRDMSTMLKMKRDTAGATKATTRPTASLTTLNGSAAVTPTVIVNAGPTTEGMVMEDATIPTPPTEYPLGDAAFITDFPAEHEFEATMAIVEKSADKINWVPCNPDNPDEADCRPRCDPDNPDEGDCGTGKTGSAPGLRISWPIVPSVCGFWGVLHFNMRQRLP